MHPALSESRLLRARTSLPWRPAALAAALSLAACGGGGGGGGSSDPVTPPPPVPTLKVTLRGQVVDSPIANAVVTAAVGSRSFTATADAQGNYSLPIEVPQDAGASFVTLNADGVGAQAFVELVSLAGDLSTLIAAAGSDGVLTAAESFVTQVTNVSTAEAVLLQQANGGQPITSTAQKSQLATGINGGDVLDLATAIKLAVDSPSSYPLPSGQATTLTLALNTEAREAFIASAQAQDPAVFQQTATAVAADPAVTPPLPAGSTPPAMLAAQLSDEIGFTFNFTNRVMAFEFAADGSASVTNGDGKAASTWQVQGNTIAIRYAEPVSSISFPVERCGNTQRQVQARFVSEGVSLNRLSDRTLALTTTFQITYLDCPELSNRTVTETAARTLLTTSDFQTLTLDDVRDATQSLQVFDASTSSLAADVATFNADGSGRTVLFGLPFQWTLTTDGRGINVNYDNGVRSTYRLLRDVDTVASDGFYDLTVGEQRYIDAGASISIETPPPVFTAQTLPARYYQFGIGNETAPAPTTKGFRLRFDANGSGSQEDDFIDDNGNLVTVDSSNTPNQFFRWAIDSDNSVLLSRSIDINTGSFQCQPGSANCATFDERRIYPAVLSGSRYYWIEKRQIAGPNEVVTDRTPATYLARFYDVEALPAGKAARAAAPTGARPSPSSMLAAQALR